MKTITKILMVCLALALAACGAATTQTGESQLPISAGTGNVALQNQLLMGTLLLEGSQQAVTPAQAAQLLPLWKTVKALASDDTISQAEMEGLYLQIKESMTAEQWTAIEAMDFTQHNNQALVQQYGGPGAGDAQGTPAAGMEFQGGAVFSADGPPGGGAVGEGRVFVMEAGPGGGPEGGPGGGMRGFERTPNAQMATAIAQRIASGSFMMNTRLLDPLIALLEKRAAE